jgi:hypothetical protein
MFTTPVYDQDLLDAPLWHVELPGRRLCVAENAEGVFLVLFTNPARAHDFAQREALGEGDTVSPTLYSITRAEFQARAETSAAGGARGVVVDPQANGKVGGIIEFQVVSGETLDETQLS